MVKRNIRRNSGFTLPEILVAVAMVGVLSAAVLPTVVGQVAKTEISRIIQDIQSVAGGAQVFRGDIGRWPGSIEQLVEVIDGTMSSSDAGTVINYTTTEVGNWKGPYLTETAATISGLSTVAGATILDDLDEATPLNSTAGTFLRIEVTPLDAATAEAVNLELDGGLETPWDTNGQIQWVSTGGGILSYFPYPFK